MKIAVNEHIIETDNIYRVAPVIEDFCPTVIEGRIPSFRFDIIQYGNDIVQVKIVGEMVKLEKADLYDFQKMRSSENYKKAQSRAETMRNVILAYWAKGQLSIPKIDSTDFK